MALRLLGLLIVRVNSVALEVLDKPALVRFEEHLCHETRDATSLDKAPDIDLSAHLSKCLGMQVLMLNRFSYQMSVPETAAFAYPVRSEVGTVGEDDRLGRFDDALRIVRIFLLAHLVGSASLFDELPHERVLVREVGKAAAEARDD